MNSNLDKLQPYPFEKLAALKAATTQSTDLAHIALSIGEPKHEPPAFVLDTLKNNIGKVANYAATKGLPELRTCISDWAIKRFGLTKLDANAEVLPVNGTREALFAITQCLATTNSLVMMPNPFYQIYEGATLLANAQPFFINCTVENRFLPDFDAISDDMWQQCSLLFLCTPGNPTGTVLPPSTLKKLIGLADKHDFYIASDECYSELYFDEQRPPVGLLQACAELGRDDYDRCLVFHSLSKRSNLPGLRSGFVAGDAKLIEKFLLYRTYHGCAMPLQVQYASIAAWSDETHVLANRDLYRSKFTKVLNILDGCIDVDMPEASFYLWPRTPIDEEKFAQKLFAEQNITVLPGSYLARNTSSGNPGKHHVRMALVATIEECEQAAHRLKRFCERFI